MKLCSCFNSFGSCRFDNQIYTHILCIFIYARVCAGLISFPHQVEVDNYYFGHLYFIVHMINTSTLECLVCDPVLFFLCHVTYCTLLIPRRKYLYPLNGLVGFGS